MNLKNRVENLELTQKAAAGYTVIGTGAGEFGAVSWAEVGDQRIERTAEETEEEFLDRAKALGKPNTNIIHHRNALPKLEPQTDGGA